MSGNSVEGSFSYTPLGYMPVEITELACTVFRSNQQPLTSIFDQKYNFAMSIGFIRLDP